jgi:uncharacterized protein (TIGR02996 family)
METEDAALWRAVVAAPHDDAPRLVLADWLDENGRPERAEFVRLQCRLARMDEDDPARGPLERRERQLWIKHGAGWRAPLPTWLRKSPFRRGFVYPQIQSLKATKFLQLDPGGFAHAPLWDVELIVGGPVTLDALKDADRLRGVAGLGLHANGLGPDHLADFLAAPALENVRALWLRGGPHTPEHVGALAESPAAGRLTRLSVYAAPGVGCEGAEVLARSPAVRNLESLELVSCALGDSGLRALLGSPYLTGLKELRIPSNGLTANAVRAMMDCRHLRGLRVLDLHNNQLDDDGARVLSMWPHAERLTRLDLGLNRIHRPGAESLAQSPFLVGVRHISLLGNPCAYDRATVSGLRFRFADRVCVNGP